MAFENGVNWQPVDPDKRGRHKTVSSAFDAAFKDLTVEKNAFFDSLCDNWKAICPNLPAHPGRYEDGKKKNLCFKPYPLCFIASQS